MAVDSHALVVRGEIHAAIAAGWPDDLEQIAFPIDPGELLLLGDRGVEAPARTEVVNP